MINIKMVCLKERCFFTGIDGTILLLTHACRDKTTNTSYIFKYSDVAIVFWMLNIPIYFSLCRTKRIHLAKEEIIKYVSS